MTELSLNVLDIVENSTAAHSTLIKVSIEINSASDFMEIRISDNGCGMSAEQLNSVVDPFYTTRKTRKVGLGVPFFKQAAEITGGTFVINSTQNVGTDITARFVLSSIDRMPLGDICQTMHQLIIMHQDCDFLYTYTYDGDSFALDTREFREALGNIPFDVPEVSVYIRDYLKENTIEVNGNKPIV